MRDVISNTAIFVFPPKSLTHAIFKIWLRSVGRMHEGKIPKLGLSFEPRLARAGLYLSMPPPPERSGMECHSFTLALETDHCTILSPPLQS